MKFIEYETPMMKAEKDLRSIETKTLGLNTPLTLPLAVLLSARLIIQAIDQLGIKLTKPECIGPK